MTKITQKMLFYTTFCAAIAYGQSENHSFLTLRPPFQSGTPERESLTRLWRLDCLSFIQCVPLVGRSVNPEGIARYFMPFGRSTLLVAEDGATDSESRDLAASHFNVKTKKGTFKSTINLSATHQFWGFGLAYRQLVAPNWWVEWGVPFLHVENRFRIREVVDDNGGGAESEIGLDNAPFVSNMVQAFKQDTWNFGKINNCVKLVKEGFSDLEFKVGYQSLATEDISLNGYLGLVFPTSNKPNARYIFEPMLGNNGHYAFMYGSHLDLNVWERGENEIDLVFDINTRYLFANCQMRSFDLKNKEFSRYIASYKNPDEADQAAATDNANSGTSGINLYTHPVKVRPGISASFIGAFRYCHNSFEAELGYNFFVRQHEDVFLNSWTRTSQVRDVTGLGRTNKARTMNQNFEQSFITPASYEPIRASDIKLNSCGTPAALSYTWYVTGGYYVCEGDLPVLVGLGASYEFDVNDALNQWMVWAKLEVTF